LTYSILTERGAERRQRVHVEAFELAACRIAHAEDRRIHRGADPQHAAGQHFLQAIGRLGLRRGGSREKCDREKEDERFHVRSLCCD
jgi:hypothetical protein